MTAKQQSVHDVVSSFGHTSPRLKKKYTSNKKQTYPLKDNRVNRVDVVKSKNHLHQHRRVLCADS